jgi:tight adherence protein B
MLLIVLSVCLCVCALAVIAAMTVGKGASKRISVRLAALDREVLPAENEEPAADIRKHQDKLSTFPWLNRLLTRMNLATRSSLFFYQAGVTTSLGAVLLISVGCSAAIGYVVFLRSGSGIPALLVAAACLPVPLRFIQWKRAKRLSLLEQQLPEALSMMASALRVGHSFVAGLGAVGEESPEPIGGEMRKCFEEQNYGIELRTSLMNLTRRVPVQDFRIFVAAVLIQKESGGNLAEVLEKVVQTARERFRLKKQVGVHTAQGKMTGWVLSMLPVIIGIFMYMLNPDGMSVLWKRPIGLKMLYIASGMDFVGAMIIRKIVKIQV